MQQIEMRLGWGAAFRIAWAIVIVQAVVGLVFFVLFFVVLGSALQNTFS